MLAYKDGDRVRLVSRNGRDDTRRFADLAAAVAKLSARTLVLDGELAIYDHRLRSRFDWLREPDGPRAGRPTWWDRRPCAGSGTSPPSGRSHRARPVRWRRLGRGAGAP
jgi:hypothetical protein